MVVENEFVQLLKKFDITISKIPWKYVTPVYYDIKVILNEIFSKHINIHSMKEQDVIRIVELIQRHRINEYVKIMILSRWIVDLDNIDTYTGNKVRRYIVEDHVFKIVR
jgi:hypothetical protein